MQENLIKEGREVGLVWMVLEMICREKKGNGLGGSGEPGERVITEIKTPLTSPQSGAPPRGSSFL